LKNNASMHYTQYLFIATSFVILVSFLAILHVIMEKNHLAKLSYFSQYPSITTLLHDGIIFMSYEWISVKHHPCRPI